MMNLRNVGRATLWVVGSTIAALSVAIVGATFVVFSLGTEEQSAGIAILGIVFIGIGIGAGTAMFWRRAHPMRVLVLVSALAAVFPISSLGSLIALPWVLADSTRRAAQFSTVAVGAVTAWMLVLDSARPLHDKLFTSHATAPELSTSLTWWGYVLVWVLFMTISVSVGLVRRFRAAAAQETEKARAQYQKATSLRGELNRKEERELIAREMHDTVAHQLSLISLQAGVLEVTTSDPNVPESARLMRENVHRALDEMRVLIGSLRDSESGGYTGAAPDFDSLTELIAEAGNAGASIVSELRISEPDKASSRLTSAVYRIVQEALTNAIKYGNGTPISVCVLGSNEHGVNIEVINEVVNASPRADQGGQAGLPGMQERAAMLGGSLTYQNLGKHWRVIAHLPWSTQ